MGMFTEWRDDEIAKLQQQLQKARAENAALVAEFQRLADEPPTLEEIAADLDKIEMLEKELAEARAEIERKDKLIEQMREALQDAIDWIEDDRFDDDYISEQWYHDGKAALEVAERGK